MQISLHRPDMEQFVEEKGKSGEYATPKAVIENALETLRVYQMSLPSGEDLRQLIAEGQAEADRGELLDGEEVFGKLLAGNAQRPRPT